MLRCLTWTSALTPLVLQLIAAIPESRTLQRAGAAGTALPQDCPAAIAGHALAGRILGERISAEPVF